MKLGLKAAAPLLIVLAFSSFLLFFKLGDRSFRNPDEGRYAEIAKEMVVDNNWVEPRLYGVDYLKKPILFYWLVAASFKIGGFTEFAGRFVPALFSLLGILITFGFARKVFDSKTALFASLILASNFWYLQVGRYLIIDAVFSFFVVAGLYAFYLGVSQVRLKLLYYSLFYACAALSFLSKGVPGIAIPGIAVILYLGFIKRSLKPLKEMHLIAGAFIFLLLTLPWFISISLKKPDFINLFFFHEQLARFVSKNFEHQEPWYYYFLILAAVLMPWTFFLRPIKALMSGKAASVNRERVLFLLLSSAGIILFFSLAKGKLATYILPMMPLLSIVIGNGWVEWSNSGKVGLFLKRTAITVFGLIFLSAVVFILAVPHVYLEVWNELPEGMMRYLRLVAGTLAAGSVLVLWALKKDSILQIFYSLIVMMALCSVSFFDAMKAINVDYSTKYFAQALKPRLLEKDPVYIYGHPGAFYDFRFYLGHPVKVVGIEGEMEDLTIDERAKNVFVSKEEFNRLLGDYGKFYCLIRKSDFLELAPRLRERLIVIKEDRRKVLFQTQP